MLKNKKLLIDKNCPMCNIYGQCFTKLGLLEKGTLSPYQTTPPVITNYIDMRRARNEIALFDNHTQETIYGLDALLAIITHRFSFLQKLLYFAPIHWILLRVYRFISYNRKVIYPAADLPNERTCNPDINLKYRWIYIFGVAILTGIILNQFAYRINTQIGFTHDPAREFYVCLGQIVWQIIAIFYIKKEKMLEYLGNMSTVSMIGGILLIPILWIGDQMDWSTWNWLLSFSLVVGLMLIEHIRRCRLLGLSLMLTISWVTYRSVVLAIILAQFFFK